MATNMMKKELKIIGANALITVAGIKDIPAKVDTGASLSSIWASNLRVNDQHQLEFTLLAPGHELYTGEVIKVDNYEVQQVRNSTGDVHMRYRVTLPATIKGKRILTTFTLANRSKNNFPILIGRLTLKGKFLVDVSKVSIPTPPSMDNDGFNDELRKDPQGFHQKYMSNGTYSK